MKRRLEKLIARRRAATGERYEVAKAIVLAQDRKSKTYLRHTQTPTTNHLKDQRHVTS